MNTLQDFQRVDLESVLDYWKNHPFFAPETVVLGIDIGIEGIGIAVRRGQECLFAKTLLVDLPEAKALAKRRAFRAARHARKNRKLRMRRLRELFSRHGLPWVDDDIMSRSDPFKLRHRAITGHLASREALSICIRSCVLRRGYDYFAMNDDDKEAGAEFSMMDEMPWGSSNAYTDAEKWIRSAYVDEEMKPMLIGLTPLLTIKNKELDPAKSAEWYALIEARYAKAEEEGIPATLRNYAKGKLNEKKARGKNFPRAHVAGHLKEILARHQELIDNPAEFEASLFRPCKTKLDKKFAIFYYNRKTPAEATHHFNRKVKMCPYCSWLNIPSERCGLSGDMNIRLWKLIDFVSCRTFDFLTGKLPAGRQLLPAAAVKSLLESVQDGVPQWSDAKKKVEAVLKKESLKFAPGDWNKAQFEQLKDIVAPAVHLRRGRAAMSAAAARGMVAAATADGTVYAPSELEKWKKDSGLYKRRAEIDATGGIYPQVQTLLGTLKRQREGKPAEFGTTGYLQRLFTKILADKLNGKTVPDYCVIECIKNAAPNTTIAEEIQREQKVNRARREKLAALYGKVNCSHADFLRMRLFAEQGGSPTTPAVCPFTGQKLDPADLFSARFQLAHIYPDSRGGLYMAENLVLTTAEVNQAMGNRTPAEAAQAALPGWLSWEEMQKQARCLKWNAAKIKCFLFRPSEGKNMPEFENLTRTAQLARELRRRAAVWMGICGDEEQLRKRIGNPHGLYTAAARRSFLWQGYVKDRSDNRHHRLDAAVMTCLPPDGLNDVRCKGIFQTELIGKNRTLMCIEGLPIPDFYPLRNDGDDCPIVKISSSSRTKPLGGETFWHVDENGRLSQRIPLNPAKIKTAKALADILRKMNIPEKEIPSEKALEKWLGESQAALKSVEPVVVPYLRLNNGTPVRRIWKDSSKGHLDKSPQGWSGLITPEGKFHQLRNLSSSNDRLEIWLGWNVQKGCWEYYKHLIPTAAVLVGFKRMGLPWRGIKGAPEYLLKLLEREKATDLRSLICGVMPPHAVKVATFRKGDSVLYPLQGDIKGIAKSPDFPVWWMVTAIASENKGRIACKCCSFKDQKVKKFMQAADMAKLKGLHILADEEAKRRNLTPPV